MMESYTFSDKIKENDKGGACRMHGGERIHIIFQSEIPKGRYHL
jgi:hypothetical protein